MERYRAIANPDERDPSFSVPCRRCAELLQEGNRFCPFCFEDQLALVPGDRGPAVKPERDGRAGAEARSPEGFDFMDTVQPDVAEIIQIPRWMGAAAGAGSGPGMGLVRLVPYWQTEVLEGGKAHWATHFATPRRLTLGIASVLGLMALAFLTVQHTPVEDQNAVAKLRAFKIDVEQAQTALNGGDLSGAEQRLEALETDHADDATVQTLREAFDLRLQEQSARRVQAQPVHTARETFSALGLDEPAAPPSASPSEAPSPVAPVQAAATVAVDQKACSEALSALALCAGK